MATASVHDFLSASHSKSSQDPTILDRTAAETVFSRYGSFSHQGRSSLGVGLGVWTATINRLSPPAAIEAPRCRKLGAQLEASGDRKCPTFRGVWAAWEGAAAAAAAAGRHWRPTPAGWGVGELRLHGEMVPKPR